MSERKSLTENSWKTNSAKFKIKNPDIQKALAAYDKVDDSDHDQLLDALAEIKNQALTLKKSKEVAANPALAKYIADMLTAAESQQRDVAKNKVQAQKDDAARKKSDAAAAAKAQDEDEDGDSEEEGHYSERLLAAFKKLKGEKNLVYEFVICDAKPLGIMIAKKISAQHKAELMKLTGSKKILPVGTCTFQDGKFAFTPEKPLPGLARKLQEAIKSHTGKKMPILAGTESAGDEPEEQEAVPAPASEPAQARATGTPGVQAGHGAGPVKEKAAKLHHAAETWHGTRKIVDAKVSDLKKAIKAHYANGHPDLLKEIDKGLGKLDAVLDKLDHRLASSLSKAGEAENEAALQAELKNSKVILAEYIGYVKSEPLIAHMDSNPFGVKINLRQTLVEAVTHAAQTIG
jgi:hypothetical protein